MHQRQTADEAVSPIIGTILMVAIVVVLAGVVFMIATNLGKSVDDRPIFGIARDETMDRFEFNKVHPTVPRVNYEIRMSASGDFDINADATGDLAAPTANIFVKMAGEPGGPGHGTLSTGDYMSFCAQAATPGAQTADVTVEIRHSESNSIVWKETFLSLRDCPG